jgi:hypothetical protein
MSGLVKIDIWLLCRSVERESVERGRCSNAFTLYAFTLHALDTGYKHLVGITPKQPKWFLQARLTLLPFNASTLQR